MLVKLLLRGLSSMDVCSFPFNKTGLPNVLWQCIPQLMLFVKEHFLLFAFTLGPASFLECSLLLCEITNNEF